jgi:hypothetical protein
MSDQSEREQRALDALFVSQLRTGCEDETDTEHLPQLTTEERKAMDSFEPDFVRKLLTGEIGEAERAETADCEELVLTGEVFGMNRAYELDDATTKELDRQRQEIINRAKHEDCHDGDTGS